MIRYLEAGNSGTQIQSRECAGLEYKGSQQRIKLSTERKADEGIEGG